MIQVVKSQPSEVEGKTMQFGYGKGDNSGEYTGMNSGILQRGY